MPVFINPKLTDAGKAAAVNANANGLQLAITHVALGTGKYDSTATGAGMTTMAARKEQVTIGAGVVTSAGGFRINVKFAGWAGSPSTYEASELGFYAGDPAAGGVLFAIYSSPTDILVVRNGLTYVASFTLQIVDIPASSVTVTLDPTMAEALTLMSLHENATDPHPVYVKKSGSTSTGPQFGVTAPRHDNSEQFITSKWAKRQGLSFPAEGGNLINANTTLTTDQMGRWLSIGTTGVVVTLPPLTGDKVGASYGLICASDLASIQAATGEIIVDSRLGASALNLVMLARGDHIVITNNGSAWYVTMAGARMPVGAVNFFASSFVPPGWLKLNGSLLTRTSYPSLWQYAQDTGLVSETDWANNGYSGRFTSGTTSANFRIPDVRGLFLRAWDDGRGMDAGREWGRYQADAYGSHNHGVYDPSHTHGAWTDVQGSHNHGNKPIPLQVTDVDRGSIASAFSVDNFDYLPWDGAHGHNIGVAGSYTGISIYANGANETRSRNMSLVAAIKY